MDKIEQREVLKKVARNVVTLQDEISLDELKSDPRRDIPDLLNTNPDFVKLLEIYYKADRLLEVAQQGMGLIFEAVNGSIIKLDKEILQEQEEKKYDLVYFSRNYMRRVLHIQDREGIRALCGTMPRGSVEVYNAKLGSKELGAVSCIPCSKALDRQEESK